MMRVGGSLSGWSMRIRRGGLNRIGGFNARLKKNAYSASWGVRRGLLTESYARGPTEPPLLTQTIPEHFASIVAAYGDRTALVSRGQGKRLTYAELHEQSNALALGLREQGVRKGDRVAVSLGNGWEFGVITYALFKLGAILVPLNPAFNAPQVISALSHLEATHLVIGAETNLPYKPPRENVTLLKQLVPDLTTTKIQSESVPSLKKIILVDNSSSRIDVSPLTAATPFQDVLLSSATAASNQGVIPDSPLAVDDTINIQFTSGTTSMPKAACLTHKSILNNGYFIGRRMGLTSTDIVCCPPPLFHCFGSVLGYMATATHGACIVFPSEAFNPTASLLAVQEERATALYGVSTMFVAELELLHHGSVENKGFEHLRTGIAAGSSVPSNLMGKLHQKLNLTGLTICYGMTETSPVSCMTTPDDPYQKRIDSVGRPLEHVEVKVVDEHDRERILPLGERGELVVSGYLVMNGYWGDEAKTKEVRVVDPATGKVWMHTGDEAEMDSEGYVRITGRIKDLIIRGGENIHPLEVENALFAHENVSEVSVVGLPDERYGECVAAFVVPCEGVSCGVDDAGKGDAKVDSLADEMMKSSTQDPKKILSKEMIRIWVKQKLSNHLVPKYVFWVKEYPKTASGKIQKFKLKEDGIRYLKDAENESEARKLEAKVEKV
ncbi:putative AMP-binding enzyme [Xylogone sp. PMI_703]|nr:putative AMP-binding enzyme [Xylogone sp. PMI_703]